MVKQGGKRTQGGTASSNKGNFNIQVELEPMRRVKIGSARLCEAPSLYYMTAAGTTFLSPSKSSPTHNAVSLVLVVHNSVAKLWTPRNSYGQSRVQ